MDALLSFARAVFQDPLRLAGIVVCTLILAAVVCRINAMRARLTRPSWLVIYLLFAIYALGVLLDLLLGRWVDWYDDAGTVGVLLYMAVTRRYWRRGQDPVTVRGELRHADGSTMEDA